MPHLQTVGIAFALMVAAVPAAAAEQRRHDAHQHGGGRIDVAVEGGLLSVVLEVPAVNLVGFEHAPRGDAQKARIREWMGDGIVRASIGLENSRDLIADLDRALRGRSFKGLLGPLAYRLLS